MNPLKQLESCGQAPWLDFLKGDLITSGELKTLIERDGLKGLTSNPAIFEKAINNGDDYAKAIAAFVAKGDASVTEVYEHLAIADIQAAADALKSVYEATDARDGYVSLECSPYLANDTEATIAEAQRLWDAVARHNLMVKVPATPAGIPAIRELIGRGININVTLLFAVSAYEAVAEAYISGLEHLSKSGGSLAKVASVASFFVSRIDSAVDKKLDALGKPDIADRLRSKVAIANAKLAYQRYQALFAGARWKKLADAGAQSQRLLWASTSTKNPSLPDTLYVEALIGKDTVDTIPPATMDAFRDHGTVKPDAIEEGVSDAHAALDLLDRHGISLQQIADDLVVDGVKQFSDAFDSLLSGVARRRAQALNAGKPDMIIAPASDALKKAIAEETEEWRKTRRVQRLWAGDATVWSGKDEAKWLGWLGIVAAEQGDLARLKAFSAEVKSKGFTDVVLLGMGGSSLGPDVLSRSFGSQPGAPRFHMLDSTDPAQVRDIEQAIALKTTLFICSSKSGSTLEPDIFLRYFLNLVVQAQGPDKAGAQFVVVTDPGSALEKHASEMGFAHIFHGVPAIGGRYSVLSKFGLVPAAAIGLDIEALLKAAQSMVRACGSDVPAGENPGVQLGLAMGVAATTAKRDKVTILTSPKIASVGAWLEQLIAESTGKLGKGIIPLAGEPLGKVEAYGADRFFAYLELEGDADAATRDLVAQLEKAGHPIVHIHLKDLAQIGAEFFRWEVATAVAGAVLGINPFDQPDVEASKVKTRALTDEYEKTKSLPKEDPVFSADGISIFADPKNAAALGKPDSLSAYLKAHFDRVGAGDYVALLAYIQHDAAHEASLVKLAGTLRDAKHAATCVGFGPRFLHSTGQAYKGGPNTGVFLQITCDDPADLDVPGRNFSFSIVKAAQARGDLGVLTERDRRALRVHLADVDKGLETLSQALAEALA